jgi:hypothetical protein
MAASAAISFVPGWQIAGSVAVKSLSLLNASVVCATSSYSLSNIYMVGAGVLGVCAIATQSTPFLVAGVVATMFKQLYDVVQQKNATSSITLTSFAINALILGGVCLASAPLFTAAKVTALLGGIYFTLNAPKSLTSLYYGAGNTLIVLSQIFAAEAVCKNG